MVDIYGKARTQGTLFAEDLNQLAGRGVPIFQELARVLNVSQGEIKKMASEGQITFPMLQKVFSDLTSEGGKFFGMMEKQSGTTKGLLSTLKSELDNLLIAIGTPINDFLKPIIASNIGRMQALNQRVAAFLTLLAKAREQGQLGELLGSGLQVALIEGINLFSGGIRGTIAYLAAALPPIFEAAMQILSSERTLLFFEAVFKGGGDYIASAIQDALSNIPGLGDLANAADASNQRAGIRFGTAGALLSGADFAGTFDKMASAIADANTAGIDAFKDATKTPLIDPSIARGNFKEIAGELDPEALQTLIEPPVAAVVKQVESLEQALGGLDTSIKKATPEPAKPTPTPPAPNPGLLNRAAAATAPLLPDEGRRRGLLSSSATTLARLARGEKATQADLLGLRRGGGGRLINPARAAERLARGNAAADPGRVRRTEKAEAARAAADPLFRVVKAIDEKFANLVTA
jgi:tape measure domain-containing protein